MISDKSIIVACSSVSQTLFVVHILCDERLESDGIGRPIIHFHCRRDIPTSLDEFFSIYVLVIRRRIKKQNSLLFTCDSTEAKVLHQRIQDHQFARDMLYPTFYYHQN